MRAYGREEHLRQNTRGGGFQGKRQVKLLCSGDRMTLCADKLDGREGIDRGIWAKF